MKLIKFGNVKNLAGKVAGKAKMVWKAKGPEILTGVNIATGLGATVTASVATTRLEDILDESKVEIEKARSEGSRGALAKAYFKAGGRIAKNYALPAGLQGISIFTSVKSTSMLRTQNTGLAIALTALTGQFRDYRKSVREEIGEERERDLYYDSMTEDLIIEEDGETKVKKVLKSEGISPYARFFDETNVNWQKNHQANLAWLHYIQQMATQKLRAQGHLFLNEVYDMLGIPRSAEGAVVGWVLGAGDDYVDFGIYDLMDELKRNFVNGYEPAILLDFNVDGDIMYIFNKEVSHFVKLDEVNTIEEG